MVTQLTRFEDVTDSDNMNVGKIVDSENVQLDEMVGTTWNMVLKGLFVCFVYCPNAFLWQVGSTTSFLGNIVYW